MMDLKLFNINLDFVPGIGWLFSNRRLKREFKNCSKRDEEILRGVYEKGIVYFPEGLDESQFMEYLGNVFSLVERGLLIGKYIYNGGVFLKSWPSTLSPIIRKMIEKKK